MKMYYRTQCLIVCGICIGIGWLRPVRAEQSEQPESKVSWRDGFRLEQTNPKEGKSYRFRFRTAIQPRFTYVATDGRTQAADLPSGKKRPGNSDDFCSFNMRRLRFYVDGSAPNPDWSYYVHLQLEPQSGVNAHDAIIEWRRWPQMRIQFGRMKIPAFGLEFWQSGFMQNGTDRTIFTGDSENDTDLFGGTTYDFPGGNSRYRVGGHLLQNGFSTGGLTLYRSQGININGSLDLLGSKQALAYWMGLFNGRDSKAWASVGADLLVSFMLGINFLPGSDPEGPLGPSGFANYTMQGDFGYNQKPLGALVLSSFRQEQAVPVYYAPDATQAGWMRVVSAKHDVENYGFDAALLFRWYGFSLDLEFAWEEFIQQDDELKGFGRTLWNRSAYRANLGMFVVPKTIELTAKYADVSRIDDNNLEKSLASGLGLVKREDVWVVEDGLRQVIFGINLYLDGFSHFITADFSWMSNRFKPVGLEEAQRVLQVDGSEAEELFEANPDGQDDIRLRCMYQFIF